jgi:hypothetical protein
LNDALFGFKRCTSPTLSDGGASGWTDGYCSASCLSILTTLDCPNASDYCNSINCFQSCPAPRGGQSTCRPGYVCDLDLSSDGGVVANSAHCVPNCNNAPAARCGSRACGASGYCL